MRRRIKGIIVIVLLCYSYSMSAAPVSSTTWSKSAMPTSFKSTSTGIYRGTSTYRPSNNGTYNATYNSTYNSNVATYNSPSISTGTYRPSSASYRPTGGSVRTTSSQTMHSWGGYNNAASNYSGATYRGTTSQTYRSTAVRSTFSTPSIPTLAKEPTIASTAATSAAITKRNVYIAGLSEEDGKGKYYDEEEGEWLDIPTPHNIGDTKEEDGKWWVWNGSGWVESPKEVEPIGAVPYLMILLLLSAYMIIKFRKKEA